MEVYISNPSLIQCLKLFKQFLDGDVDIESDFIDLLLEKP